MVPRENKNNAHAKFGGTNKEYYGIFQNGLLLLFSVMPMLQCGKVTVIANASTIASSQVLSLPLTVNPTVSVVTPVAANAAFQLATVLATYTCADVTIVGDIILPNNLLLGLRF